MHVTCVAFCTCYRQCIVHVTGCVLSSEHLTSCVLYSVCVTGSVLCTVFVTGCVLCFVHDACCGLCSVHIAGYVFCSLIFLSVECIEGRVVCCFCMLCTMSYALHIVLPC